MPSSIFISAKASSTSEAENLTPKVIRECLKASASILPSISKASKEARMTSSSSEPPAILEAGPQVRYQRRLHHPQGGPDHHG